MKNIDTIQINKLSHLHDGKKFVFCKTDFLIQEFETIKKLDNEVILISGNSDFVIDDYIYNLKPDNVIKWFAQNAMFNTEIIECIPLGIENLKESFRENHGIGYERVRVKEMVINNQTYKKPSKLIYANFRTETNSNHRNLVKNICISTDFIDWEEPNLTVEDFLYRILDYNAIVCAQGNGPGDNHRIYETLYMNRIPVTFNTVMYNNLHHKFPVVCLENIEMLRDKDYIEKKINESTNKNWDDSLLSAEYWIKKILSYGNSQLSR